MDQEANNHTTSTPLKRKRVPKVPFTPTQTVGKKMVKLPKQPARIEKGKKSTNSTKISHQKKIQTIKGKKTGT
jgi:hypothetical protein